MNQGASSPVQVPSLQDIDALLTEKDNEPVEFRDAWISIMSNPVSRQWTFNRCAPTADELIQASKNAPVFKSKIIQTGRNEKSPSKARYHSTSLDAVFGTCYQLTDGTQLGFVLNSVQFNYSSPAVGAFDPAFADGRLIVNRLVIGMVRQRLFCMEFSWNVNGVLVVRMEQCSTLTSAGRFEQYHKGSIHAFKPNDATTLAALALCPVDPNVDFMNARFEKILGSDAWYVLEMTDTKLQSACLFCEYRGLVICGCPMPMRRRISPDKKEVGYAVDPGKTLWDEFSSTLAILPRNFTAAFTITKFESSRESQLLESGFIPFKYAVSQNAGTHDCMQMHLGFRGTPNPTRVTLAQSNYNSLIPSERFEYIVDLLGGTEPQSRVWVSLEDPHPTIKVSCPPLISEITSGYTKGTSRLEIGAINLDGNIPGIPQIGQVITKNGEKASEKKVFHCPECGIAIRGRRGNLRRHIAYIHKKERLFKCPEANCTDGFQSRHNLQRHIATVHRDT